MGKFKFTKTVSLATYGPEWSECYLKFEPATMGELRALGDSEQPINLDGLSEDEKAVKRQAALLAYAEIVLSKIKEKFISGRAWDGNAVIDVQAEDLDDLPPEVVGMARKAVMGDTPDPNS